MNLNSLKVIAQNARTVIVHNSPTILTAIGAAGVITTAIFAIRGTVLAVHILEQEAEAQNKVDPQFTPKEIIRLTWKCYIPTLASGLLTITSIVGANHISLRRNAALASLYTISERAMKEYEEKVIETIGEKKEDAIKSEIAQDKLDRTPFDERNVISTGHGETLFFDSGSGRYFKSDREYIRQIVNDFNHDILQHGFKTLNEFYYDLGLEPVALGDIIGWGNDYEFLEVRFDTRWTSDHLPCGVLSYKVEPENK